MPDHRKRVIDILQACEKEPIHLLGGIQPIGVLLILSDADFRVIQASANSATLLGRAPAALLGLSLDALVVSSVATIIRNWHAQAGAQFLPPIHTWLVQGDDVAAVDLVVHRIDQTLQLEMLPVADADRAAPDLFHDLLKLNEKISAAAGVAQLLALAANEVAAVTGAQRVMVYEFDADYHGTVTFEKLAPGCTDSYMGLRFPASDIPAQARALYLKNRIRVIADTHYLAVPLEPALHPMTGLPADLTHALLRSVSPVHLEYLGNMGVRGSMSISLVVDDALWGMIICHHERPLLVSADHRNYCEVLGQIVALHIGQLLKVMESRLDFAAQQTLFDTFPNDSQHERFAQVLMRQGAALLTLFAADGMVLRRDGRTQHCGIAISDDAVFSLATLAACAAVASADLQTPVFANAGLADALVAASFEPIVGIGGFLYIPVPGDAANFILLLRVEQVRQVTWAGNPNKADDDPQAALAPRKSFANWQETVRGQCTPWTPTQQRCARQLASLARDRLQIEALRATQDRLLQAEKMGSIGQLAAGVAHEINNPIGFVSSNLSTLQRYWKEVAALIDGYDDVLRNTPHAADAIARTACLKQAIDFDFIMDDTPDLIRQSRHGITRVHEIVQNLTDFSHVGSEDRWAPSDLVRAMDNTLELLMPTLRDKAEVVRLYDSLPPVWCMPSQINQVFHNLLRNAGQAIEGSGIITVHMHAADERVVIDISDTGVGIAPAILDKIFDPFFTTRDVGKGTGLGLSVAYGIIDRHRGELSVKSAPHRGTLMRISLPVRRPDDFQSSMTDPSGPQLTLVMPGSSASS